MGLVTEVFVGIDWNYGKRIANNYNIIVCRREERREEMTGILKYKISVEVTFPSHIIIILILLPSS